MKLRQSKKVHPFVNWCHERTVRNNFNVIMGITGATGCQPKGSKVLMANGVWKNIEQLKKGDEVLSPQKDGSYKYSKIIKTTSFFSGNIYDIYELNRQKKKLYSCSFNHEIPLNFRHKNGTWSIKEYIAEELYDLKLKQISSLKISKKKKFNKVAIRLQKRKGERVYGFELDSPSHWYITDNFMVTKNTGKSWAGLTIGEGVDANFNVDRVCFSIEEFEGQLKKNPPLPPGSVIVVDDAGLAASNRDWQSKKNMFFSQVMQSFRYKRLIVIFTVPHASFIDKQARMLFHILLKTQGSPSKRKGICKLKCYHLRWPHLSKASMMPFTIFPRIKTETGYKRVNELPCRKPTIQLRHAYEAKKAHFMSNFYEEGVVVDKKAAKGLTPLQTGKRQQMIYNLINITKMPIKEIAKIMGISISTVHSNINTMREKGMAIKLKA